MNRRHRALTLRPSISRRVAGLLGTVSVLALIAITTAASASSPTVVRSKYSHGGHILGTHTDYTLYVFCSGANDNCKNGHTSSLFPPYIAYGQVVGWKGVNKKKLGTKKINGKKIVTYYGEPLYRYKGDKKRSWSKGEDHNGSWFVVIASGLEAGQPAPPDQY